jgi:hypothetical protein
MGAPTACQAPTAGGGGHAAATQPQADRSAACWLRLYASCCWEAALPSRSTFAPWRSTPPLTPATCTEPSSAMHAPAPGACLACARRAQTWKRGCTTGHGQPPRQRRLTAYYQVRGLHNGQCLGRRACHGRAGCRRGQSIMGAHVVVDGGLSWKRGSPLLDRLSGCSPPPKPPLPMAGCSGERRLPRTGWWPRDTCTRRRR